MHKVRFTTRCAGGCGIPLVVGTRAVRLHGGEWCLTCLERHRPNCLSLRNSLSSGPGARKPSSVP